MENIADFLTGYLIRKSAVSETDADIYRYGIQNGMEFLLFLFISSLIAIKSGMVLEGITFMVVFFLLRSYTGGLHMKRYISCLVCSCVVFGGILFLVKRFAISSEIAVFFIVCSAFLIYFTSPVENENRKVDSQDVEFFSRKIKQTLAFVVLAAFFLYIIGGVHLLSVIMYTQMAIWLSMVAGKIKNGISNNGNK